MHGFCKSFLFRAALAALAWGCLAGAAGCGSRVVRQDAQEDDNPLIQHARARCRAQDYEGAIALYMRALEQTPRLARALYFTARRGGAVREELFTAVATILAFVMRFDAVAEDEAPPVFVPPDFDFDEQGQRRKAGAPLPL